MKKVLYLPFLLLFFAGTAYADPFDLFNYFLNTAPNRPAAQKLLDYFAEDIGQAIAGGSYGVGGDLGLMGVKLSIKMSYQQISQDNEIIRAVGETTLTYPVIQGEFGIFEDFDGILRLSNMNNSTLLGGGVRYRIREGDDMFVPTISIQSVYNFLIADDGDNKFNAWNLKTSPTAYFGQIPYIQPYVFISYDVTSLTAKSSARSGLSSLVDGFGYGAGGNLSLGTVNVTGAISMYNGNANYNFGIFIGI
ncbi:MAG: hypothetical protein FWD54_00565 [Endomicrobia bacterium]|nr:hypothetical protein [Endomicrobiia bacterium]MCL2798765.1 hypothetical protein [Endomicrobiia bacterium]